MYPETDVPMIIPNVSTIILPELIEQKTLRYAHAYGLSKDLALSMAKEHPLFEDLVHRYKNVKPMIIANFLDAAPGEVKSTLGVEADADAHAHELLALLDEGKIAKEALVELLGMKARGLKVDTEKFKSISEEELRASLTEIIAKDPNAPIAAHMGEAMKLYRGKIDGKRIMTVLKDMKENH